MSCKLHRERTCGEREMQNQNEALCTFTERFQFIPCDEKVQLACGMSLQNFTGVPNDIMTALHLNWSVSGIWLCEWWLIGVALWDKSASGNVISCTCTFCQNDINHWMAQNRLQLNKSKSQLLLFNPPNLHNSLTTNNLGPLSTNIKLVARNPGVLFDPDLSFAAHVKKLSSLASSTWEQSRR